MGSKTKDMRVLVCHWGRSGAGPLYTLQVINSLTCRQSMVVHVSYSVQSEMASDFENLAIGKHKVSTYTGLVSAIQSTLAMPLRIYKLRKYILRHGIEIVYSPMSHPWNVFLAYTARSTGAKYVVTVHDAVRHLGEENRVLEMLTAKEIRLADAVVTLSPGVMTSILERGMVITRHHKVIPLEPFPSVVNSNCNLEEADIVKIGFVGRIHEYKGLDLLLEAFKVLSPHFQNRLTLTVAGSGDLRNYLGNLSGVTVINRWLSHDELFQVVNNLDCVVLPYREASQSGVVAVAFGAGVPVIATRVGDLPNQVEDGVTGLLTEEVSTEAIARAIDKFASDPILRQQLRQGVIHRHSQSGIWTSSAKSLEELFFRILDES